MHCITPDRTAGGLCCQDREPPVVTVQDRGVGIHASMRKAYPDIDESLAVIAAFSGGVTSEVGPIRGLGLMMVLSYTETGAKPAAGNGRRGLCGYQGKGSVGRQKHIVR